MEDSQRCEWARDSFQEYRDYHDKEWGVPVHDERTLFEFLILEGAQAGLSWSTILKKRNGNYSFRNAMMTESLMEKGGFKRFFEQLRSIHEKIHIYRFVYRTNNQIFWWKLRKPDCDVVGRVRRRWCHLDKGLCEWHNDR